MVGELTDGHSPSNTNCKVIFDRSDESSETVEPIDQHESISRVTKLVEAYDNKIERERILETELSKTKITLARIVRSFRSEEISQDTVPIRSLVRSYGSADCNVTSYIFGSAKRC